MLCIMLIDQTRKSFQNWKRKVTKRDRHYQSHKNIEKAKENLDLDAVVNGRSQKAYQEFEA